MQKVFYDPKQCQLDGSLGTPTAQCVTVCPVEAITQASGENRLIFDHNTCIGCGSCVAICPAGAIEYVEASKATLEEIYPLYENRTPLLISRQDLTAINIDLPSGVVPFTLNSVGLFSEADLMGLFMESGSQIVIYKEKQSLGQQKAVALVNEISQRIFGLPMVLWAFDKENLKTHLENATLIAGARKSLRENHTYKREQFAARLKLLIGGQNYGVIAGDEYPTYGEVLVDEKTCTLCMGCVSVCSPSALFVSAKDGALMGDFSKCTQCGECVAICPEKSMQLLPNGVDLSGAFFAHKELAKDTEFCCVECGKPFATSKSIMKIVAMMEPLFISDPAKARTLRCCADCKPKVMMRSALSKQQKEV